MIIGLNIIDINRIASSYSSCGYNYFNTMRFATALMAICQLSLAQSTDAAKYQRWADLMDTAGYTWEAFDVTTEDDYILTVFHITGTKEGGMFSPTKEPVLI